jgi:hypothetical protein
MPKKNHILKEDFSPKYHALGLASSESVFQMVVLINNACNTSLKLTKPVSINNPSGCISFDNAVHDEEDDLKIHLFKNKTEGQLLFKNQSAFDFLIISTGRISEVFNQKLVANLKTIRGISLILPIEAKNLKNYNNLLL